MADFAHEQLLHADLNLRFGAKYMADQLEEFNNELFVAFAAYNAGPTAATRWRATSGDDADLFLQTVEFQETQLYVEIVAENGLPTWPKSRADDAAEESPGGDLRSDQDAAANGAASESATPESASEEAPR